MYLSPQPLPVYLVNTVCCYPNWKSPREVREFDVVWKVVTLLQ